MVLSVSVDSNYIPLVTATVRLKRSGEITCGIRSSIVPSFNTSTAPYPMNTSGNTLYSINTSSDLANTTYSLDFDDVATTYPMNTSGDISYSVNVSSGLANTTYSFGLDHWVTLFVDAQAPPTDFTFHQRHVASEDNVTCYYAYNPTVRHTAVIAINGFHSVLPRYQGAKLIGVHIGHMALGARDAVACVPVPADQPLPSFNLAAIPFQQAQESSFEVAFASGPPLKGTMVQIVCWTDRGIKSPQPFESSPALPSPGFARFPAPP